MTTNTIIIKNKVSTEKTLQLFVNNGSKIKCDIIRFFLFLSIATIVYGCTAIKEMNIKDCKNEMLNKLYIENREQIDARLQKEKEYKNLSRSLSLSDVNTRKKRLTPQHLAAICLYTEEGDNYKTINKFLRFNKSEGFCLKEGELSCYIGDEKKLIENTNIAINSMTEAFSLMKLKEPCKTYRGTSTSILVDFSRFDKNPIFLASVKEGDSFTDKGFVSSSTEKHEVESYATRASLGNPDFVKVIHRNRNSYDFTKKRRGKSIIWCDDVAPVLLTIHNAVGLNLEDLSPYPQNKEVLLLPNTTFYVYYVNKDEAVWDIRTFATKNKSIKRTESLDRLSNFK